ncbi:hypothetical protein [uncultured Chitinophaga sp.]|uniref:hypothetical protein n=1 Tax=uncultured Chitinophaga sp. TaxID=339340 RepID=UPI002623056E|nr:hypothetical protein [uncultured Chitinophaga sp.]
MWRKKTNRPPSLLAIRVAQGITWLQMKWVNWMQQREARLTNRQKKWSLAIFMICSCSVCVLIFLSGITPGRSGLSIPVAAEPVRMPAIQPNASEYTPITQNDTLAVRLYLHTIDSMQQTEQGRAELQDYFRGRPGLADSIEVLRKLFNHQ